MWLEQREPSGWESERQPRAGIPTHVCLSPEPRTPILRKWAGKGFPKCPMQAGHKICTAVKTGQRREAAARLRLCPPVEGTGQRGGAGLHPACHPSLLLPLAHPQASRGPRLQVHMSSAGAVSNRGTGCPLCVQGYPGCAQVLALLGMGWPMAGAPGVPGREPSAWTRTLRLRGPHSCQVENLGHKPRPANARAHAPRPWLEGSASSSLPSEAFLIITVRGLSGQGQGRGQLCDHRAEHRRDQMEGCTGCQPQPCWSLPPESTFRALLTAECRRHPALFA